MKVLPQLVKVERVCVSGLGVERRYVWVSTLVEVSAAGHVAIADGGWLDIGSHTFRDGSTMVTTWGVVGSALVGV